MNNMTYHKTTHYGFIQNFDDVSTPKYMLFEYNDSTGPNKLLFSTNSPEEFQIKVDLLGLSELKEINKNGENKYYSIFN